MGKAALIIVFGTVLYISVSQMSSKDTQDGVSEVKVEFQENTLASEIARSAFGMAERRARAVNGSADSVLAVLNGSTGSTTGDYQGGTYEYSASKRSDDLIAISAKGYFGGESHEIKRNMRVNFIPDTSWEYGCSATGANFVDITGFGLGSNGSLINNGNWLSLTDTTSIRYMKGQVGGRTDRLDTVQFVTSTGQSVTLTSPDTTGANNMGYFQADLDPASAVQVNVTNRSKNGARGFVVYAHRELPNPMFSIGRYLDVRMYHYGHTESFEIPTTSGPRSVHVDFVMYDKADDGRTVTLTVEGGALTETRTISGPNMQKELAIETLTLENVPGDVKTILVSIYSNDSLYWKMAHIYTDGCS